MIAHPRQRGGQNPAYRPSGFTLPSRRAGTALGSFYTYFDSKEEIFQALVRYMSEQLRDHVTPLVQAAPDEIAAGEGERPLGRPLTLVLRGFLVNASNPKAIIFILAVLPQFLDPKAPLLVQYLLMAATMVAVDLVVMAGYTGLAARVLRALRSPRQQRILNRTFGGLFVAAAALLATVRRTA